MPVTNKAPRRSGSGISPKKAVATQKVEEFKTNGASGPSQHPSSDAAELPPLKLKHRLFAPVRASKQSRKRPKLSSPQREQQTSAPTPPSQSPTAAPAPSSTMTIAPPTPPVYEENSEEPVYRGSIAHMVLQRLDFLDSHRLREDPFDRKADKGRVQQPVAPPPGETETGTDSDGGPKAPEIVPETIVRPEVFPQPRIFSEGDRVTIEGEGRDQYSEVGFIVQKLSTSWFIVQSEDSFTSWTVHSSQMRRLVNRDREQDTSCAGNSSTTEIRTTFWNCLETEIGRLPGPEGISRLRQEGRGAARSDPPFDFASMASICATQCLKEW